MLLIRKPLLPLTFCLRIYQTISKRADNYKKEYSKDGSIFLDKAYDWNLPSSNLLLYGHNNKNGLMFVELLKYADESFYKKHQNNIY